MLAKRLQKIALFLFGTVLAIAGKAQAAPTAIPGTSVTLDPPAGFTVADNFSGLQHSQSGSSITINELPLEAYEEISTIFTTEETATEALLRQGIAIEDYRLLEVGESQVPLLRGSQRADSGEVTKYLTLFKGETTVLITFNIIDPDRVTPEMVETTVASVVLAAAPTIEDKISQLSFSFNTAAPFQIFDVLGGSAVLLSLQKEPDTSGLKPMVIIARGQNRIYTRDAADISEDLLRGTRGFSLANIVQETAVEFAGGSGYLIEAQIEELTVFQYVHVPENGRYIRLLATGEHDLLANVLPAVEDIAASVTVRD